MRVHDPIAVIDEPLVSGSFSARDLEDIAEARAELELKRLTPTNYKLLALARRHPPDQEWYEGEMEKPW